MKLEKGLSQVRKIVLVVFVILYIGVYLGINFPFFGVSAGCTYESDCDPQDGWYNDGSSYSCCDGDSACECQDQEYRDYYCSGGSCVYDITNTRTLEDSCVTCDDFSNSYCSGGSCVCDADTSCSSGTECGTEPDGCGGTVNCGSCGAEESCDTSTNTCDCRDDDGDGYKDFDCGGQDCDDSDSSQDPDTTWYSDDDGDGYYDNIQTQCSDPGSGWSMSPGNGGGDCDDSDSNINPGETDVCNGIDDDCDGTVDENANCAGCKTCSSGTCVDDDSQCSGCEECSSGTCVDDDSQCSSYCDTEGDVHKYCDGGDVWGIYDYCNGICTSSSCGCDWDENNCGSEELEYCADNCLDGSCCDYDSSSDCCDKGGYDWDGDSREFESGSSSCCEDDSNENRINRVCNSGVCTSDSSDWACCDSTSDCSYGGSCYSDGYTGNPSGDGTSEECSSGTWTDNVPPSTSIDSPSSGSWYNSDFQVDFSDYDSGGSGLSNCEYRVLDGGSESLSWTYRACSGSVSIDISSYCSTEGSNVCTVESRAQDTAGNSNTDSRSFSIDTTNPATSITTSDTTWYNSDISVNVDDSDSGGSGFDSCEYRIDDNNDGTYETGWTSRSCPDGGFTVQITEDCSTNGPDKCGVDVRAYDNAGNSGTDLDLFNIDTEGPSTSTDISSRSWDNTDVSVDISASDLYNNVDYIDYCWTLGSDCTPSDTVSGNSATANQGSTGSWTLCHRGTDSLGNTGSKTCDSPYKIDKIDPQISCGHCWEYGDMELIFSPQLVDGDSGIDYMEICRDEFCVDSVCSGITSCSYSFEKCDIETQKFYIHTRDVAGNTDRKEGGTYWIKLRAEDNCPCSYDNECLSGLCIDGRCIDVMAPEIYFLW